MPFLLRFKGQPMLKKIIFITVGLSVLTGCATTQKLMTQVNNKLDATDTPLQLVLKAQPELQTEHHNIEIRQVFNAVESPTVAQVMVLQTGLLDDSVAAIRTTYRFKLHDNDWKQVDRAEEYQCIRGKNTTKFQKQHCA